MPCSSKHRLGRCRLCLGSALVMMATALPPGRAFAAQVTVAGVVFSDELGGFVLERVSGEGSLDDPFIVVERLTNPGGATLLMRIDPAFGNRIGTAHALGLALTKVVENATDFAWTSFELELQSKLGRASDYGDGLSFGQGSNAGRPFTATGFARVTIADEPYDRVEISDGKVPVGAQSIMRVAVSESVPLQEVYLAQRPVRPVAGASDHPSTPPLAHLGNAGAQPAVRSYAAYLPF
jgi:hypothetical protein